MMPIGASIADPELPTRAAEISAQPKDLQTALDSRALARNPVSEVPLLLICDHRGDRAAEKWLSSTGFRVLTGESLRDSLRLLAEHQPALIVLDPLAPSSPIELESIDRARGTTQPAPLLLITERDSSNIPALAARVLRKDTWDLIWRSAGPEEFHMRVDRLENTRRMLSEMEELRHRASHDDRTDLLRPRAFETRLQEHFSATQRHGLHLAFILLDLDKFGAVNKEHDHTVGDRLIESVGEVIRRNLRAEDVAARLGGDEFAVLLPYTRRTDVSVVVGRLREQIQALSGTPVGAKGFIAVSASIGFETFDGKDIDSLPTLRAHAERALRAAKEPGGNRAIYYRTLASPDATDV